MSDQKTSSLLDSIKSAVTSLAKETDAVRKSEVFGQWLNTMAQFHEYSWNNQFLIALQRPDATRVAGFHTWNGLGRHVKKGSKGIAILAPITFKKKVEPDNPDSDTVKRMGYRTVFVFAYEDTDGKPLPKIEITGAGNEGAEILRRVEGAAKVMNVTLTYKASGLGGALGTSSGGKVVILSTLSTTEKVRTLVHELAHEHLHWQGDRAQLVKEKSREQRELEAEATAYVVLKNLGLAHEYASNYLAMYNVDGDKLRASLNTISGAAKYLLMAVEVATNRMAKEAEVETGELVAA